MTKAPADQLSDWMSPSPVPTSHSLTLVSDQLRVQIYPEWGAKIGSIVTVQGDHELLQQPLVPYAPRSRTMPFEEGEASGYDECIPTVFQCEIQNQDRTADAMLSVPDHGDFWRLPFTVIEADENHVSMEATGFSLPLRFNKTISLNGNRITLSYRLTNVGVTEVMYLWSAHPAFAVDAGDRIELPASIENFMVQGSGGGRLGSEGTRHSWPLTTTSSDDAVDLSLVGHAEDQVADKLFTLAPAEGWCALNRLSIGRRIEMRFQGQAPYLGLWICYGGWPENKPARQYCVAMEPCTAPTDSLANAIDQGLGRRLAAQASEQWAVVLQIT